MYSRQEKRGCVSWGVIWQLMLMLAVFEPQSALAGDSGCDSCGCTKHLKKQLKLVCVMEEVKVPVFECKSTEVFLPHKGPVCKVEHRHDRHFRLTRKFWHIPHGCSDCDHATERPSVLCCSCESDCGCKELRGAKSTGCKSTRCVRKPTGETCKSIVPVFKWITVEVCNDCCSR